MNKLLCRSLLVCIFSVLISCNNKREMMLVKRWYVADVMFEKQKNNYMSKDSINEERQLAILKDVLTKNLYEFKENGTYVTGNITGNVGGKWNLNAESITLKSDNKTEKEIPIEHLSEDSLVLLFNNDQTSVKLHLILKPVQ
ncbi:MAG: lipocalin family protein [Bacteroidia bacterium]|nr:lipocalin family protein [Bacteroidia bacterium]